jgi:DNA-binding GntR family transcriptional regulator
MSQTEEAYPKIRDAITYDQLKPGEKLVETKICEIFKVGRTPLREALRQL